MLPPLRLTPRLSVRSIPNRLLPDPQIVQQRRRLMFNILRLGLATHNAPPLTQGPIDGPSVRANGNLI
jgi:hypothetical protein